MVLRYSAASQGRLPASPGRHAKQSRGTYATGKRIATQSSSLRCHRPLAAQGTAWRGKQRQTQHARATRYTARHKSHSNGTAHVRNCAPRVGLSPNQYHQLASCHARRTPTCRMVCPHIHPKYSPRGIYMYHPPGLGQTHIAAKGRGGLRPPTLALPGGSNTAAQPYTPESTPFPDCRISSSCLLMCLRSNLVMRHVFPSDQKPTWSWRSVQIALRCPLLIYHRRHPRFTLEYLAGRRWRPAPCQACCAYRRAHLYRSQVHHINPRSPACPPLLYRPEVWSQSADECVPASARHRIPSPRRSPPAHAVRPSICTAPPWTAATRLPGNAPPIPRPPTLVDMLLP